MAYTVVVVDDEIHAIQHLLRMLEGRVPGCAVTAAFTDPREALTADSTLEADIVIVDIMMPAMSGLEFARQLLERSPHTRVVLLTAYRDFEFAKQAVGIGVHDYWVKHELRAHNIGERMAEVMAAVDRAAAQRRGEGAQRLLEALAGGRPIPELFGAAQHAPAGYFLLYLTGGAPWAEPAAPGVELAGPAALVGLQVAAGRVPGRDPALRRERYQEFRAEMERQLAQAGGGGRALLSDLLPAEELGPDLHRRCLAAAENCHFGPAMVRVAADGLLELLQPDLPAQLRMEQAYFLPMAGYVERLDLPALLEDLAHLWGEPTLAAGNRQALEYARDMLWELATGAGAADVAGEPPAAGEGPEELGAFFNCCFRRLLDPGEDQTPSMKVRRICAYIHRNYSGDLRLGTLTREFAISGDYLRKLFREEMGVTLSEYITRVRMDKARQLLKTGDYKIYEIAEMVGYHSAQYFSQAFHKATGRYPTDTQ